MTKEEIGKYNRAWRAKNKKHIVEYNKCNLHRRRSQRRTWRGANRNKIQDYNRQWTKNNGRKAWLKAKYSITPEEYARMLLFQNCCCAICGTHQSKFKRQLHIDHNHKTGKLRGLLCVKCNHGIGCFDENILMFDKAKKYVLEYEVSK